MRHPQRPLEPVRLTELSHGGGCACKLGMSELEKVLTHLPRVDDPRVLVDASTRDDAAVYALCEGRALVVTTDFFPPMVDDPFDFGRVAAANALSDVYAMGARPMFALSLLAFPRQLLDSGVLDAIIRGAGAICAEEGIGILGGHSIDDREPKFGLVVVGDAPASNVIRNSGAVPGDRLVLTKPLGSGVVTTAIRAGVATADTVARTVQVMTTTNRAAAEAMHRLGATAATDVTGYGLIGHLRSMLRASGVAGIVRASDVPLISGASALARAGQIAGGTRRNLEDLAGGVDWDPDLSDVMRFLLADAQTSGGLLVTLPEQKVSSFLEALDEGPSSWAVPIGEVVEGIPGHIRVLASPERDEHSRPE